MGAPLRTVTVRDTIGDLPPIENGEDREEMAYDGKYACPCCDYVNSATANQHKQDWAIRAVSLGNHRTCVSIGESASPSCSCDEPAAGAGPAESEFQRMTRGEQAVLLDHVCKTMNPLNLQRCKCIPVNTPGADWRVLLEITKQDPSREKFQVRQRLRCQSAGHGPRATSLSHLHSNPACHLSSPSSAWLPSSQDPTTRRPTLTQP